MELDVNTSEANVVDGVETVEVIAGGEDAVSLANSSAAATLIDQHMAVAVANPQEILVPTSEVQIEGQAIDQALMTHGTPIITIPVGPPSPGAQQLLVGTKRSQPEALTTESLMAVGATGTTVQIDTLSITTSAAASQPSPDIPRKKSRNYLDSHKTIEKKRRDRINNCLDQLKSLIPDCRQYGSKKLDKAEILEMSIEYIQKIQTQGFGGRSTSGLDINMSQREWANDLTTWVIQNKILHTGANALDGFCQSLLLHLQSMGSGNALASATSMLLNQASAAAAAASSSEEDALFRQQTTANTQAALLQQIQQQQQSVANGAAKDVAGTGGGGAVGVADGGGGGAAAGAGSSTGAASANQSQTQQQLQQAQLTQLQALLLLQQQQQLLNQQQQQETDAQSQQTHLQQLQQLQQLQALLLQHIANEASSNTSATTSGGSSTNPGTAGSADSVGGEAGGEGGASQVPTSKSDGTQTTHTEATLQVDDASSVLTGSNPMTGEGVTSAGLGGDHPGVELSQPSEEELAGTTEETVYTSAISQMWSSAGSAQANQSSSLLMLGGGSESEGEGVGGINGRPGGKSSLIETSEVQEEVELLSQQEH